MMILLGIATLMSVGMLQSALLLVDQSRQPCPMENQYHETEKTVFLAKKQYHSLRVLFFRSHFGKARLCKGLHKTVVRTSLPEELLTRSLGLHVGY